MKFRINFSSVHTSNNFIHSIKICLIDYEILFFYFCFDWCGGWLSLENRENYVFGHSSPNHFGVLHLTGSRNMGIFLDINSKKWIGKNRGENREFPELVVASVTLLCIPLSWSTFVMKVLTTFIFLCSKNIFFSALV